MPLSARLTIHSFTPPLRQPKIKHLAEEADVMKSQADDVRLFRGIFGMPSNHLISIGLWTENGSAITLPDSESVEAYTLTPTARPRSIPELPEGGIVVFRWFDIDAENLDEFVALSDEAWASLEASFDCRIMGLFKTEPQGNKIRMLLYTWYASHAEWERSRDARPEAGASKAWENFMRRQLLTDVTEAIVVAEIPLT